MRASFYLKIICLLACVYAVLGNALGGKRHYIEMAAQSDDSGQSIILKPSSKVSENGESDDSVAIAAAIRRSNENFQAGKGVLCIYAPAGVYNISSGHLPSFVGPGCIKGDGPLRTVFRVGATYKGDIFSWSEAWMETDFGYGGPTTSPLQDAASPLVEGFSLLGSRAAQEEQNAFVFKDRNDLILMRDVSAYYFTGSCLQLGRRSEMPQSYAREAKFFNLRFWGCGSATTPAVEITSSGNGDATNELTFFGLDVVGSYGTGLMITNDNPNTPTRLIDFFGLRVEGSNVGNLINIDGRGGVVADIGIHGLRENNGSSNRASFLLSASRVQYAPYNIRVQGVISSGKGSGVQIEAGRNLVIDVSEAATSGAALVVGARPFVGDNVLLNETLVEKPSRFDVEPSSRNALRILSTTIPN